jgi:Txe/YoeB family toxin of toxin-antitoxin system
MGPNKKYTVRFSRRALKDLNELLASNLRDKTIEILDILADDPFWTHPPFEKLRGDLSGRYSRRLNIEHRVVYKVLPDESGASKGIVHIDRMKTHYKGMIPIFLL